jgi:hypothetical protein
MAQATGTFSSYDAVGNREDLIDNIFDVSPVETPVLSAIKKKTATNRIHEWQTDALAAAAVNAQIEGDDASPTAPTATTRLNNNTQIMSKHVVVSGTQEKINSAGRNSEVGYQAGRRMQELKKDAEYMILDGGAAVGNAKVTGNDTTAREMASLNTYMTSNVDVGATGAAATGDGTDTMTTGTDRDLTATILDSVLTTGFTNGANPKMLVVSPTNKTVVGDFTAGGATRYVTTDDKKLTTSVDVYVGDFHTLQVVPCRQLIGDNAYAIDPEYLAWAELRSMTMSDLAKTGDTIRKEIIWEGTLEVCNEAAHCLIADTNG